MTLKFAPGTPSWVDLGTTDVPAAGDFYRSLFGWTIEDMGPEAGGYGMIRLDGLQVGGIGPATDPTRGTSWSVYFATDSADHSAAQVTANGGTVVVAPMDVMDQGRMAVFQDPAGAYFSVWEPGHHHGAEVVAQTGAMSWIELTSAALNQVKPFYEQVLGVTIRDVDMGGGMSYTLFEVDGQSVAGAMSAGSPLDQSHWSVYFSVDDCDATADKALALGGSEIIRENSPAGRFAFLLDPQGGRFCIIKPNPDFSV